jgi:hypothetical protein
MSGPGLYGALLHLYPRAFRLEYGEDMSRLLALQLRDERALRVWCRTAVDLALTVPALRLECLMSGLRTRPTAFVLYAAAAAASLVLTAISGTSLGMGTAGLLLGVAFASLAVVAWRRARTIGGGAVALGWRRFLGAGVAGTAACVVVANLVDDELPSNVWFVWMLALLTSMVLATVGIILGLTQAVHRRTTSA